MIIQQKSVAWMLFVFLVPGRFNMIFGWFSGLKDVTFPRALQHLTFGASFNQSLEEVSFEYLQLQSLALGNDFNQSLERVTFPPGLQFLTFGASFNQPLTHVALPPLTSSLVNNDGHRFDSFFDRWVCQTAPKNEKSPDFLLKRGLKFGKNFNQCLDAVNFPCSSGLRQHEKVTMYVLGQCHMQIQCLSGKTISLSLVSYKL